jgi:pimeloyl-ACP methyl ester carboxylesterase
LSSVENRPVLSLIGGAHAGVKGSSATAHCPKGARGDWLYPIACVCNYSEFNPSRNFRLQIETHTRRLADGRMLAWTEAGEPTGFPVFVFHGLPGSRFQRHPDDGIARIRGARLIHVERPGFGVSSPQPNRRLDGWPRDVAALADALGVRRFGLLGISGGGPFALACAALLGDRAVRTAVAGGVGPPGSMKSPSMTWAVRTAFRLAPHAAWLLAPSLASGAQFARRSPQRYLDMVASHMSATDRAALDRPEVRTMFARDLDAAFAQGSGAMLLELKLLASPWRLPLESIRCPTAFWHGTEDRMVPDNASRTLAGIVATSTLHLVAGEGHFTIFECWSEIVDWLMAGTKRFSAGC